MSHTPEQMRKKAEAMEESQRHHKYSNVQETKKSERREDAAHELREKEAY